MAVIGIPSSTMTFPLESEPTAGIKAPIKINTSKPSHKKVKQKRLKPMNYLVPPKGARESAGSGGGETQRGHGRQLVQRPRAAERQTRPRWHMLHSRPANAGRLAGRRAGWWCRRVPHTGAHGSWNVRVPVSDLGRSAIRRAKSMSLPSLSLPRIATRPTLEPRRSRRRRQPHLLARTQTRVPLARGCQHKRRHYLLSLISLHSPTPKP